MQDQRGAKSRRACFRILPIVTVFLTVCLAVQAQEPVPLGAEFQVNARSANSQTIPSVAMAGDGSFMAVYQGYGPSFGMDIIGRRIDETGNPDISELVLNTTLSGQCYRPEIAMNPEGAHIIVYYAPDSDGYGIYGRLYDSTETIVIDEFLINNLQTNSQTNPDVAMDEDGNFVVVYETIYGSYQKEVFYRRYDSAGNALNSELCATTTRTGNQDEPAIAMDDDGNFVVVWEGEGPGGAYGIWGQRFDSSGTKQGGEFQVDTPSAYGKGYPDVGMDFDGNFVAVWDSNGQDGSGKGIYAKAFDSSGAATGSEFLVNTRTASDQGVPRISMTPAGDYTIVWHSDGQDGNNYAVCMQSYSKYGSPQGSERRVNTYTTNAQWLPAVARNASDHAAVVWESIGQDGSGEGIFCQIYDIPAPAVTSEFLVNTYTTSYQYQPCAAMSEDGDFVIAWQSTNQDAPVGTGVYGQRYASGGTEQGTEFQVNTWTDRSQNYPEAAMDDSGNFVVVWQSEWQDTTPMNAYGQRFASDGTPQGGEFRVNTTTANSQTMPVAAMMPDGAFVVAYPSGGPGDRQILAQRYASDGSPVGSEFQVSQYATSNKAWVDVAIADNGSFVVVWMSYDQDGSDSGIYARLYDSAGTPQGNEFLVPQYTSYDQNCPQVAMDRNGNFVVAWQGERIDMSGDAIVARRYDNTGTPLSDEFQVNTTPGGHQRMPSMAMAPAGDFVIVWHGTYQDVPGNSDNGVFGQRFNASGIKQGPEFQVNVMVDGDQEEPSVAMDDYGNFVVTWQSEASDGNGHGVWARLYEPNPSKISILPDPPTATVTAAVPSPTRLGYVAFYVDFSKEVANFDDLSDLDLDVDPAIGWAGVYGITPMTATRYGVTFGNTLGSGDFTMAVSTASDVQDLSGNALESSTSATVTLDHTPPNPPVVTGPAATSDDTPTWTWTSGGGGSGNYHYDLDGTGSWTALTGTSFTPATALSEGSHTLEVLEEDDLGSWSDPGSHTIVVDKTPPTLSIGAPSATLTSTGPVGYTVTYTGADSITLQSSDITLATTGTAAGTVSVSGSGTTSRTVTISSITGNGTLGIASIDAGTASDAAGNTAGAAGPGTPFSVDNIAPGTAVACTATSPANASPLGFTVDFTEPVPDFTSSDLAATNGSVSGFSGSGASYSASVTPAGDGNVTLTVAAGVAHDAAGNANTGDSASVNYDGTPPEVADCTLLDPTPTAETEVRFAVTFTENVTGAGPDDFTPRAVTKAVTGAFVSDVTGGGDSYTVTVNTGTGDGELGLDVQDDDSIEDAAGNALGGTGASNGAFSSTETYSVNKNPVPLAWWPVAMGLALLATVHLLKRKRRETE